MSPRKKNKNYVAKSASSSSVGIKAATRNYKMVLPSQGNNVINIIDKTRGAVRNGRRVGEWVVRFDQAHRGAPYPHININEAISHIPDPHIRLGSTVESLHNIPPSSALKVAKGTANVLKKANKVMLLVAIAVDTIRIVHAVAKDIEKGSPKNTVKTVSSVAGGWGGGYGGALGGAAIGSAVFPGVGTIVGGIIGGIVGGVGGSVVAEKVAEAAVGSDEEDDD